MRYYTSDTHFGHARIIELCNRPFKDIHHMDQALIENWNSVVTPEDTVYHLGDVALGSWDRWDNILTRLNGYKILVVGNHDRLFRTNSKSHRERFLPLYQGWFNEVHDWSNVEIDGRLVALSHFPYDGDSHGEDRFKEDRLNDAGIPLIHGHTHNPNQWFTLSERGTPMFHVGVDAHNFRPVPETTITDWLRSL